MIEMTQAISAFLTSAGLAGGSTGWPIQLLQALDVPDQVVVISMTGGPEPEQDSARRWLRPRFQVMCRGAKNVGPHAATVKAQAIMLALDRAAVSGLKNMVSTQSTPVIAGADPDGRAVVTVNFRGEAA